jgi:hypothetical protein
MKRAKILLISILLLLFFTLLYFLFLIPKIQEVEFLTNYTISEEFNCGGTGISSSRCYVNISFNYLGKEYQLERMHLYGRNWDPNCGNPGYVCPKVSDDGIQGINITNGQLKITGLYDSKKNLLFNYTS